MRSIILLTFIVLKCCIQLHCLPLPAGQIIKYRVSSKYFNRNNETTSSEHSRESLYNLLTQIHYGDVPSSTTIIPEASEEERVTTEMTTDESPEAPTTAIVDVTEQQDTTNTERIVDKSLNDLIEEFVKAGENEEEEEEEEEEIDSTTVDLEQATDASTERAEVHDEVTEALSTDEIPTTSIIESDNDNDSETEVAESNSTNVPSDDEQPHPQQQQMNDDDDEEEEDEAGNEIPESLLSAVGDLLSSVLSISVDSFDDSESESFAPNTSQNAVEAENLQVETTESDATTAGELSTETQTVNESLAAADDDKMTEIDEKIGNLNQQITFMTENAPEFFTEAVKGNDESNNVEVLEVTDESDANQPVSISESVNRVINLVKGTTQNVDMQVQNVKEMLKEIGTSLGLTNPSVDEVEEIEDESKSLPIGSFDRETMKNFETDINEMMSGGINPDEHDNFVPNVAKAAMYYKYQYDDDF